MLSMLQNWGGRVELDGVSYENIQSIPTGQLDVGKAFNLKLHAVTRKVNRNAGTSKISVVTPAPKRLRISVKAYMTRKATPEFDFMAKWNNDIPMPLRIMTGTVEKETRGMIYMKLHGVGESVITCMRCGKQLTNPISQHYGIGPECMSKIGIVADIEDVDSIKKQLVDLKWEGWIIRSAITEQEEV